jgi:cell division protein FtsW
MTTTANPPQSTAAGSGKPAGRRSKATRRMGTWTAALRDALDRPLTSYYLLIGASVLLLTIGLIMVLSASSVYSYKVHDGDSYAVVKRQLMWVIIGLPCAWIASRVSHQWIRRLAYPAFSVSLVLLLLTAFVGVERNGNTNWLGVGPFVIQPSEIAKLSLVIWAAHIYANKDRRLGNLHQIMVPVVPGMLLATGLVIFGKDLGTAMVLFAILIGMLWVVGAPMRFFVMVTSVLSVAVFALATTSRERFERITTFVDPFKDFHETGWQPAHGLYAFATGGIFGQGIGASQQKWGTLPEAHTDFIFAVLGEELGLVGTVLVVALFLTIAFAALRVARETTDPFVRYASFGIVVWLLGQMIINVGMVLALLPVIGIPLPLVSYGGSSLLPTLAALGLLVGFARREPAAARALAQRRQRRSAGLSARR